MARPRKPKYEYVEQLHLYRKRVKDSSGKYVALYGQTPEELTERILEFSRLQAQGAGSRENPYFNDYAQRWMNLHGANLTFGGRTDYQSCIDCNIKPYMEGKRIRDIRPDDIRELMLGVAQKSESIYRKTYIRSRNRLLFFQFGNKRLSLESCKYIFPLRRLYALILSDRPLRDVAQKDTQLQQPKGTPLSQVVFLCLWTFYWCLQIVDSLT